MAHTEGRDLAELATLGLDGIELYQLHANLDPDIRMEYLGLARDDYLAAVIPFFLTEGRQPDLATLGFLLPNEPSIVALEPLGQSQRLTISAGTDAHQNVFTSIATDGERGDSYRRMIRWFNNRIRATELTPQAVKAALRAGNNHIVFESFGTPVGFDFHAEGEAVIEMGAEASLAGGPLTLRARCRRSTPAARRARGAGDPRGAVPRGRGMREELRPGRADDRARGPGARGVPRRGMDHAEAPAAVPRRRARVRRYRGAVDLQRRAVRSALIVSTWRIRQPEAKRLRLNHSIRSYTRSLVGSKSASARPTLILVSWKP